MKAPGWCREEFSGHLLAEADNALEFEHKWLCSEDGDEEDKVVPLKLRR